MPLSRACLVLSLAGAVGCLDSSAPAGSDVDRDLRSKLQAQGVTALERPAPPPASLVALGRLLMFDKVLSGNKNISCGTCHHPSYHTNDNRSLAIGEGGRFLGPARELDQGTVIGRNTLELYNRGAPGWSSLFWDGRVGLRNGGLVTPAGNALPPEITAPLPAQAMFPVLDRAEMRGQPGDTTTLGEPNELALLDDHDPAAIWAAIMRRVLAIPDYRLLFQQAFPGVDSASLGYQHAALAMAAFETAAFTLVDAPFDRYLRGDGTALSDSAKRGALLFYGRARCSVCHSGPLLTDQRFHNIGVPQVGPGRSVTAPLDLGRAEHTGQPQDRFAFRTPSLRNVVLTGPWMHNGAYTSLRNAIRHYRDPVAALEEYDATQLDPSLQSQVHQDPATRADIEAGIDRMVRNPVPLTDHEIEDLFAFLLSLTDPVALDQVRQAPGRVPSGLPVIN